MKKGKPVVITEIANKIAEELTRKKREQGIPATKGGLISELIINAKMKD